MLHVNGELAASSQCVFPDGAYTVRDVHQGQRITAVERVGANLRDAVRDRDAQPYIMAVPERIASDPGDAILQLDGAYVLFLPGGRLVFGIIFHFP